MASNRVRISCGPNKGSFPADYYLISVAFSKLERRRAMRVSLDDWVCLDGASMDDKVAIPDVLVLARVTGIEYVDADEVAAKAEAGNA